MARLAFMNLKGGTGKTTSTVYLAALWQRLGITTLVLDLDSQGGATKALGLGPGDGMARLLVDDVHLLDVAERSSHGVLVVPGGPKTAHAEMQLANEPGREAILRGAIDKLGRDEPDVILIDTPPVSGVSLANALAAAERVVVPLRLTSLDLAATAEAMQIVSKVQTRMNPELEVLGLLATHVDGRRVVEREARSLLAKEGLELLAAEIPRTTSLCGSFSLDGRGAEAYRQLAQVLGERMGLSRITDTPLKEAS